MIVGITLGVEPVEYLSGDTGIHGIVLIHENVLFFTRLAEVSVKIGLHVEENGGFALGWKCLCLCLLFRLNLFLRHLFLLGLGHETDVWELIHSAMEPGMLITNSLDSVLKGISETATFA